MNVPSVTTLTDYFGSDVATELRRVLSDDGIAEGYEQVEQWVRQCFHRPSGDELIMAAANQILGGFGVEPIRGRWVDSYHADIQAAYVNRGDTYAPTILLDHETGRFHVTSWGDWVERHERTRQLV